MSATTRSDTAAPGLRRELKVTDAAAFSIGLIGPVGAMALLGVGAAGLLGQGAVWAFVFAVLGVSLVGYGFIKLSQHISHTGSVYALVGRTIGPRAGFVAGTALLTAYATIGTGSTIEIALFFDKALARLGLIGSGPTEWIWTGLVALVLVVGLSLSEVRVVTRALLVVELAGAALVVLLCAVVLVRVGTGHAPHGQTLSWDFLQLPPGTGVGTIAAAAVFGFLAFAGFEGAASLGEETMNPKREIPRALKITIVVVGVFFLITIVGQVIGYGTGGVSAFAAAEDPYGDLAGPYLGTWMAVLLDLVASLSLFAITLGTVNGAARIGYALVRDSGVSGPLVRLTRRGAPAGTIVVVSALILVFATGQWLVGTGVLDATMNWLTLGTLALLVAYALATLGALRFLFTGPQPKAPRWQAVIPALALAFLGYTIFSNVADAEGTARFFPYVILAVLVVATCTVVFVPGLADRVRARITDHGDDQ
ncbi:APC family permease [Saccharopolyspora flava]|uniref:Amino acid/polyamine/organocation transporter, APC superfamily (TC 2.A.3) n=1 Tax=Saccharopolyspora flava TaxID=95161 RepID=A0A1I6UBS9_9PSEU|nr:APC family permease [Saccharopolyspora flava]SFS98939.1 amino acid/polyamine/organocation transporter, APC superfamily (TC 2.A.3) [Saccharopolyspora flava]